MHGSVRAWVAREVARYQLAKLDVIEVGSYDVNGSVRDLFCGPYLGVDVRSGPGVDCIWDIEETPTVPVELVVCTEMLEHTPHPWIAVENMARSLMPGGHLLLTTRSPMFPPHDHPGDFYRFTRSSIELLVHEAGLAILGMMDDPEEPGVFVHAIKPDGRPLA